MNLPIPGMSWPEQGGIRITTLVTDEGRPYELILAGETAEQRDVEWGRYGTSVSGAESPIDGMANTVAMAEAGSQLAQRILALSIDGHSDFYLPAHRELMAAYAVNSKLLEQDYYWSSSQSSRGYAWVVGFDDGGTFVSCKDSKRLARPVRRVFL